MRRFLLLLAAGLIMFTAYAQDQLVPSSTVPPAYPLAAKAKGLEGTVTLKAIIDETGAIQDLKVVNAALKNSAWRAINAVAPMEISPVYV